MAILGDLSAGDIIELNETVSGVTKAVDFIVLAHNHHASGRTTVVRKEVFSARAFDSRIGTNVDPGKSFIPYSQTEIDAWLTSTYKQYLDSTTQTMITDVNISSIESYDSKTGMIASTISRDMFLLSRSELCGTIEPILGTAISYFSSDAVRIAYLNSVTTSYWARDIIDASRRLYIGGINALGQISYSTNGNTLIGVRPAFTLPSSFRTTPYPIYSKQNGVWVQADKLTVKDSGVHKDIKGIYYKQSGVWLEV